MKRRNLYLIGGIALGVLACAAGTLLVLNSGPPRRAGGDELFSISRGESLAHISTRLQSGGFIRFAPLLDLIGKVRRTQSAFKAGYYRIPAGASTLAVHDLVVAGAQSLTRVTIPEGWTLSKIARRLEAEGICAAADFIEATRSPALLVEFGIQGKSLEGFLFQDTYMVPKTFPAATMAELMVKTFFDVTASIEPDWKQSPRGSMEDTVIMASIVEREYQVDEEAPVIASVFYNRLQRSIGLESCATLEYIITEIQQKAHPEYITIDDEKIDSPYNTYKWAGLPPGPISNPGRTALAAALHPARTDYLYFVLRDPQAGRHFFSRDLTEHNKAKYLYLKKP